ncbi:spore germination protein [Proteiniborus sp. MB09-C3]|uniref:spore germination protein n=1 Tax=Proteiniborus sp. MB09-C3 TaxID=3050072 RepID=UPI0025542664|nr:spore germination protein [Proteiniborus sp. MB09-C3]WIV12421.1 spore germination protein [Proteiniborus sp. MB09-C3]
MLNFENIILSKSLENNIETIKKVFNEDDTLIIRQFENQHDSKLKCCIFFVDGMANTEMISENIISPIVTSSVIKSSRNTIHTLQYQVLLSRQITKTDSLIRLIEAIINGDTVLLVDSLSEALIINTKDWQTRAIEEPPSEKVLRGPREGFTESILVNLSMIRRKVSSSKLKFKLITLGEETRTEAYICYIEEIVNEKILDELYRRLSSFNMDGVLAVNYIQEFIKDAPLSPFKTVGTTERPDVVAAKLLEGRIAIILDGTPTAITLPYLFIEYFQSNEDYYLSFYFGSIGRILRILGFIITTSVPAIYLALVTFHQELIPTPLVLSISAARQGVPFPTVVELIGMLTVFEILREAGTRMPTYIGQALSIVGALVLGQAAVQARFVSAPIIIIVALSGITGLMIPALTGISIIARTALLLLSSALGLYGYVFGMLGIGIHLFSIRSFGVPYMSNLTSMKLQDLKDTFIRAPWWYMEYRPQFIASKKLRRKAFGGKNNE